MAKPELYITSDTPEYAGEAARQFSGAVTFVPKGGLWDLIRGKRGLRERYPHGTLMAVDDSPDMEDFYRMLLGNAETKLAFYGDPRKALQALKGENKANPDVIISDVNMPQMNGFEFMQEVVKLCGG